MTTIRIPGSFRDPCGFLFRREGKLFRQINSEYSDEYEACRAAGLYDALISDGLLVSHNEVDVEPAEAEGAYRIIEPEEVAFLSYPYEWCFSQLKAAALKTLEIQRRAFAKGFTLKDASAYNIQFQRGRPVLIDTLSFERWKEGEPWAGYRQFCRHFLAPLGLVALRDHRLADLLRANLDGVDLDLAGNLLPWSTKLSLSWQSHIHVHARLERAFADAANPTNETTKSRSPKVGKLGMRGLIDNLEKLISGLQWMAAGTEWADYYDHTNYSEKARLHKERLVNDYLDRHDADTVWDLGANTGDFSRIAARGEATNVVAFDVDAACIDRLWRAPWRREAPNLLPLVMNLRNPSPALGWDHRERASLEDRGPADVAMALALMHHLAIGNNVPLDRLAEFFARICGRLILEFVPKEDSQVMRLLASRRDVFPDYNRDGFEEAFARYFHIESADRIDESDRTMYLLRKREDR